MDEYTVDAFVNRDDPIPVIVLDANDDLSDVSIDDRSSVGSRKEGKRARLRKHLSASNLKEKVGEKVGRAHQRSSSMQDRILEK